MCELCWQIPCNDRCPNANPPKPKRVFVCSGCGCSICDGDEYYDLLGEQFCEGCVEDAKGEAVYDPY